MLGRILRQLLSLKQWGFLLAVGFAICAVKVSAEILADGDVGDPNVDAFLIVGGDGIGALTVNDGSEVTAADGAGIGSDFDPDAGGEGTVTVTGAGSRFAVGGGTDDNQHNLHIGNGGNGVLTASEGAFVGVDSAGGEEAIVIVGATQGSGRLSVDRQAQLVITGGQFTEMQIGRTDGSGEVNVVDGGEVFIRDNAAQTSDSSGIQLGGNFAVSGGDGVLNIDGANSVVRIQDNNNVFINIGRRGGNGEINVTNGALLELASDSDSTLSLGRNDSTGALTIASGGTVKLTVASGGDPLSTFLALARTPNLSSSLTIESGGSLVIEHPDNNAGGLIATVPDSNGLVTVSGANSLLDTDSLLGIGLDFDRNDAGIAVVTVTDGAVVRAAEILIGSNGTLRGDATVQGNTVNRGGLVTVVGSPATLTIDGDFVQQAGVLQLSVGGPDASQSDLLDVSGDLNLSGGVVRLVFVNGYSPRAGDSVVVANAGGTSSLDSANISFEAQGVPPEFDFDIVSVNGQLSFQALNDAQPQPISEIPTLSPWALVLLVLLVGLVPVWQRAFRNRR